MPEVEIAAAAPSEPAVTEEGSEGESQPLAIHAAFSLPAHGQTNSTEGRKPVSRIVKATGIMLCILLVLVVAAAVIPAIHHPSSSGQPTGTPTTHASSSNASQIQAATDAVDSATTAARAGLASLAGFPTPANVSTVMNPYINSLQLYDTYLSGTTMPLPARATAQIALAQVRQDVAFLETIDGLPSIRLGAFLQEFATDSTQLQSTLGTLETDLHALTTP